MSKLVHARPCSPTSLTTSIQQYVFLVMECLMGEGYILLFSIWVGIFTGKKIFMSQNLEIIQSYKWHFDFSFIKMFIMILHWHKCIVLYTCIHIYRIFVLVHGFWQLHLFHIFVLWVRILFRPSYCISLYWFSHLLHCLKI